MLVWHRSRMVEKLWVWEFGRWRKCLVFEVEALLVRVQSEQSLTHHLQLSNLYNILQLHLFKHHQLSLTDQLRWTKHEMARCDRPWWRGAVSWWQVLALQLQQQHSLLLQLHQQQCSSQLHLTMSVLNYVTHNTWIDYALFCDNVIACVWG